MTPTDVPAPMPSCRQVRFTTPLPSAGNPTELLLELENPANLPITQFRLQVTVRKNGGENDPAAETTPTLPGWSHSESATTIFYSFQANTLTQSNVTFRMRYDTVGLSTTSDDSYRVNYTVGGVTCAEGDSFPPTPGGGGDAVDVDIVNPTFDGMEIASIADAVMDATVSSGGRPNGVGILWVQFKIVHVASGAVIWNWFEYDPPFCAFGDDSGACQLPSAAFWSALPNGPYRLVVTARAFDGGVGTSTRTFVRTP